MATEGIAGSIVGEVLRDDNYEAWSASVRNFLTLQNLWDVVEATTEPPKPEDEANYSAWKKKNGAALHGIRSSCSPEVLSQIEEISSAKMAWEKLAKMREKVDCSNPSQIPVTGQDNSASSDETSQANPTVSNVTYQPVKEENEYLQYRPLVRAINKGDLCAVREFIEENVGAKTARINSYGFTALHQATNAGQVEVVEALVLLMLDKDLEMQDNQGFTGLNRAAISGNIKMAECMIAKNKENLVSIPNAQGNLPVIVACRAGHKEMTRYLYSLTPNELLKGELGSMLLYEAIMFKLFDVALELIKEFPHLAAVRNNSGTVPLQGLARMPSVFPKSCHLGFRKTLLYRC